MRRAMLVLAITAAFGMGCAAKAQVKTAGPPPAKAEPAKVEPAPEAPAPAPAVAKVELTDKIEFLNGSATLTAKSKLVLDDVAKSIAKQPQIELVEIEGHTDAIGSAPANKALSQARAETVRGYLVSAGIDKARLSTHGYGQEKPIAENTTAEGREKNRRVEFRVVKQAGVATETATTAAAAPSAG